MKNLMDFCFGIIALWMIGGGSFMIRQAWHIGFSEFCKGPWGTEILQ